MRNLDQQPQQLSGRALRLRVGGADLLADSSGAAFWAACDTLLVADLHLEKGSAYANRGVFLPPYDTRDTLERLALVVAHYDPRRVIVLGDSFHSTAAAASLDSANLDLLGKLQHGRKWTWIAGNHDPVIPARVGGNVCEHVTERGVTLRHQPAAGDDGCEIAGHLHPAARLSIRGETVRRRCFIGNKRRLILPAFGTLAGGLNVRDAAFAPLFASMRDATDIAVYMLGKAGVFSVPIRSLIAD